MDYQRVTKDYSQWSEQNLNNIAVIGIAPRWHETRLAGTVRGAVDALQLLLDPLPQLKKATATIG